MDNKFPTILNTVKSNRELKLSLDVTSDLTWFKGHFDNFPVLPGMVLVLWVEEFLRIYYAPNVTIKSVDNLRFVHPIFPSMKIDLNIELNPDDKIINFSYNDPNSPALRVLAKGVLRI